LEVAPVDPDQTHSPVAVEPDWTDYHKGVVVVTVLIGTDSGCTVAVKPDTDLFLLLVVVVEDSGTYLVPVKPVEGPAIDCTAGYTVLAVEDYSD